MNKEVSLSIEETNVIRAKLGLKPILVAEEKYVSDGSLSVEETNRQRVSLGLKPIASQARTRSSSTTAHSTAKANALREKITKFQKTTPLREAQIFEETPDCSWLNDVNATATSISKEAKTSKGFSPSEDKAKEDEEASLHNVRVSYNIEEFGTKNGTILTLKESSIFDETNYDVLENEKLAQETTDREKLRLRQMNRDRKQKRMNLHVSSLDIEEEEKDMLTDIPLTIGAEQGIMNMPKTKSPKLPIGKIKVNFDEMINISDEDDGDFKPVKIRKRKIKDSKTSKVRKINIAPKMETVKLIDEDESLFWMGEEQPVTIINSTPTLEKDLKSAEHLVVEIERARNEEKQRAQDIKKMRESSNNLVIDEKTIFLDSLDLGFLDERTTTNKEVLDKNGEANVDSIASQDFEEVGSNNTRSESVEDELKNEESEKPKNDVPDFFSGLASTLGFLRKKNVFVSENDISKARKEAEVGNVKREQANEVEITRKKVRNEKANITNTYTEEGTYRAKKFDDSEIPKKVSEIQSKKLNHYDPDVQLVYRDEKGNQLTTKEAYKKLSQKFHGTKSNKKKKAKMQSRIEARKSAFDIDDVAAFDDN
ncbi:hypothetical protein SUVZ_08G3300 [Saccharomyces uvarum]|uniref:Uncharacterized protein n=1 Tax=Saccharomyces uvarum TaxID=230603 RepID=A0ABN8X0F6_SACUV|nr:hypothetical protein SUVZ_08G3300 [Saccharomyces uvarum]